MSKEDQVLDRGDEFDPEEDELEEEEFESSVEDEEEEEVDEEESDDDEDSEEDEEDDSEEDEEESEDEEDSEDEEEEPDEEKGRIPRSRLNEVIAQRDAERAAREKEEERVSRLEAMVEKLISKETAPAPEPEVEKYDFIAAEEKYIDLILEGEVKDALALRAEIDKAKEDQFKNILEQSKTSTKDSVLNQSKFDTAVEAMEAKYPFLDYESDTYNEEAVESVNALMSGYVSKGIPEVEALKKAVAKMAPLFEVEEKETKKPLGNKRKASPKDDRKRNAKAAKAQPPKSTERKSSSKDLDTINVAKMSERDFSKLSDREKRILRGD